MELTYHQSIIILSSLIILIAWMMYHSGPNLKRINKTKELLQNQTLKRDGKFIKLKQGIVSIEYSIENRKVNVNIIPSLRSKYLITPPQMYFL